jgi:hypothetical protein
MSKDVCETSKGRFACTKQYSCSDVHVRLIVKGAVHECLNINEPVLGE